VNIACLPRSNKDGTYDCQIRYEINGLGVEKVFERNQTIHVDNKELEHEGLQGDYDESKRALREQEVQEGKQRMERLVKNIEAKFGDADNREEMENEFNHFFEALDRFENKFFLDEDIDRTKINETKRVFSKNDCVDRMFKRMRLFENKFYKNFDRFLQLTWDKQPQEGRSESRSFSNISNQSQEMVKE